MFILASLHGYHLGPGYSAGPEGVNGRAESRLQEHPQSNTIDSACLGEQQTETWPVPSLNLLPIAARLPRHNNPYAAFILERQFPILVHK